MDMPEKIAAWRFIPEKADEWIHGGWSEDHDHKTTEYTRSDLAVEVKPLVWDANHASTPFGLCEYYRDSIYNNLKFKVELGGQILTTTSSASAAREFAEADYNARVLSALTTRPDDLRPKLQALVTKWEGMTCRTKCAEELREVLEGTV